MIFIKRLIRLYNLFLLEVDEQQIIESNEESGESNKLLLCFSFDGSDTCE